jgi:hypothetical protein
MSATVQFTKSLAFNLTLHKLFIAVWPDISSRFRGRAVPVRTHWGRPFSEAKRAAQESASRASCSAKAGIRLPFVWESGGRHAPNATAALLGIISFVIPGHGLTALVGRHRAFQIVPLPAAMENGNDVDGAQRSTPRPRRNLALSQPRICAKAPPLSGRSVPRASSGVIRCSPSSRARRSDPD